MNTVWTNQRVTLSNNLLLGLMVLTTDGWVRFKELDGHEKQKVRELADYNRSCPWYNELYK